MKTFYQLIDDSPFFAMAMSSLAIYLVWLSIILLTKIT